MYRNSALLICFVLAFVLSNIAEAADADLLVWYKFDETTGTTAFDSSNYGNNGILMGDPQWTAVGQLGGCLDFDGSGDYVEDADGENYLNGLNELTVSAWIKSRSASTNTGFLIGRVPDGGDETITMRYDSAGATGGGTNVLKMAVSTTGDAGDGQQLESSNNSQTTDWCHVCMTWAEDTQIKFYINGVLDTPTASQTLPVTTGTTSQNVTFIVGRGGKDQSATSGWNGLIDDVRIYSRRLTQGEIEDVRDGKGANEPGSPSPADGAIDVPVDSNLGWVRGEGINSDEVYFGTDPCALPLVTTIMNLPIFPPLYDPPADLVASTTYYWEIVEVNGIDRWPGGIWKFTTVRGEAQPEYPFDGAIIVGDLAGANIWTKLIFIPGATAASHVGYFSKDKSKVESRDPTVWLGPPPYPGSPGWEYTLFAGNPAVLPATDTLVRGTKYYWTVDANDALNNEFYGDVWSFAIQSFEAFEPSPPNEAIFISLEPFLSWLPGFGVADHDIYMGTSWEDVNNAVYHATSPPPEFVDTQLDPNYQVVSSLPGETKIYWRVDQVNGRMPPPIGGGTYYKGDVWCFTTIPEFPITDPNLVGWWKFDRDAGTMTFDSSGYDHHGTLMGDPQWVADGIIDGAMEFDGAGDYINIDGYKGISGVTPLTVSAWINKTTTEDCSIVTWGTNSNGQRFGFRLDNTVLRFEFGGGNVIANTYLPDGEWHHVAMTVPSNGTLGDVILYVDGIDDQGVANNPANPFNLGTTMDVSIGRRATHNDRFFNGRIDDVRIYNKVADVRRIGAPPEAWMPKPYDGQASVPVGTPLQWMPGKHAAAHDVYFGTSYDDVNNATPSSTGIYLGQIGPNTLPVSLTTATIYYWRIDEVNVAGPAPNLWKGDTWKFRTVGAAGGIRGDYYQHTGAGSPAGFETFILSRIDPEIDFDWGTGTPDVNIAINDFSIRWSGHVEPLISGDWMFWTNTDDGVRLWIDNVLVIDDWEDQGPTDNNSPRIPLVAGTLYDVRMEYYENGGGAVARLSWDGPSTPRRIIPPLNLWPPLFATTPKPADGATIDERTPALEFNPGLYAAYHELYFSGNFDDVNNRNPGIKETIIGDPCRPYPAVPPLKLAKTYYWLVDEVKSGSERWDARTVWEFTISECLSLDNMEDYNDRGELRLVWRDGYADVVWGGVDPYYFLAHGGSSGSTLNVSTAVGSPFSGVTGPVNGGDEAMVLHYDNDGYTYVYPTAENNEEKWLYDAPYYSEI
ncbi:MAG: LamG-like jellyroll fold domain-containing protein, partial [Planctomycetota bacterium]